MHWSQLVPIHDRWTLNIGKFLLAIVVQHFAIFPVLFLVEGVADYDILQTEGRTTTQSGSLLCIVSYIIVMILSMNFWSVFNRRPYLKAAFGGCGVGYYPSILFAILLAPIWFILAFAVIPGAATIYLWIYLTKAERVIPMDPPGRGPQFKQPPPPPPPYQQHPPPHPSYQQPPYQQPPYQQPPPQRRRR